MLKASFESNLSLDFSFLTYFFPNLMIYISKELYLYISYVIKKKKDKNKLKTATRKLYVQNVQTWGDVKYYRRRGGNNIWLKYHKAQALILSYVCMDKNDVNKVT